MFRSIKLLIAAGLIVACNSPAPDAAAPQTPAPKPSAQTGARPPDIPADQRSAVAEIRLDKVEGVCQVVAATTSAFVKHGQTVVWIVRNRCTSEQSVDLVNFREKETGTAVYPFQPGPPSGCTAQANGSCAIVLVVLPTDPHRRFDAESLNKLYAYDFAKKGGDPELVIEWP